MRLRASIARSARTLRGKGGHLLRRLAGVGVDLVGMGARRAARAMAAVARISFACIALLRRLRWFGGGIRAFPRPRKLAFGLGVATLILLVFALSWVRTPDPDTVRLARTQTAPAGSDLETEFAGLEIPGGDLVREPAPVPSPTGRGTASAGSETGGRGAADPPPADAGPLPDRPSTGFGTSPESPRATPRRGRPQWLANAVEPDLEGAGPLIAIVIDDVGIAQNRTARTIDLPAPLTLAFIPYGSNLELHTLRARERGHELIVHVPMEPTSAAADPGPNALLTGLDEAEIMRRFLWGLSQFDGYVGVSNHMGSRFMARDDLLAPLLAVARERGLLFLDSRTTADTVGSDIAESLRLPNARRDVFLDNAITVENVTAQLAEAERIAREQGHAVAIGHPHDVTVDVLADWIPDARARGFTLVPISTIVRLEYGTDLEAELAAAIPAGGEPEGLLGRPQ